MIRRAGSRTPTTPPEADPETSVIHAARTRTTAPRRRPAARAGTGLIARAGTGLIALTVLAGACGFGGGDEDASSDDNCTRVPAAVSSEKIQLMTELGDDFA